MTVQYEICSKEVKIWYFLLCQTAVKKTLVMITDTSETMKPNGVLVAAESSEIVNKQLKI